MKCSRRFLFVLFVLALSLFGPCFAPGQVIDIPTPAQSSAYIDLGRGLSWGASGLGGVNNNFIFSPLTPDTGFCVYVHNNNPTSAHTFTGTIFATGDQRVVSLINDPTAWLPIFNTPQFTVAAGSTITQYVTSFGAAQIAISISGGTSQAGSPDTLDFFLVQNEHGCGQNATTNGSNGPTVPTVCDQTVNLAVVKNVTSALLAPVAGKSTYICGLIVAWSTTIPNGTTYSLIYSPNNTPCNAPQVFIMENYATVNTPQLLLLNFGGNSVITVPPGRYVCFINGTGVGGTDAFVTLSYTQF